MTPGGGRAPGDAGDFALRRKGRRLARLGERERRRQVAIRRLDWPGRLTRCQRPLSTNSYYKLILGPTLRPRALGKAIAPSQVGPLGGRFTGSVGGVHDAGHWHGVHSTQVQVAATDSANFDSQPRPRPRVTMITGLAAASGPKRVFSGPVERCRGVSNETAFQNKRG
jgi:hypothetical protein